MNTAFLIFRKSSSPSQKPCTDLIFMAEKWTFMSCSLQFCLVCGVFLVLFGVFLLFCCFVFVLPNWKISCFFLVLLNDHFHRKDIFPLGNLCESSLSITFCQNCLKYNPTICWICTYWESWVTRIVCVQMFWDCIDLLYLSLIFIHFFQVL